MKDNIKKITIIAIFFLCLIGYLAVCVLYKNTSTSTDPMRKHYPLESQIDGEIIAIHFLNNATGYLFSKYYTNPQAVRADDPSSVGLKAYKTTTGGERWTLVYQEDSIYVSTPIMHHDSWLIDSVVYMPARKSLDAPFKEIQYDTRWDTLIWTDKKPDIEFFYDNPLADSILTRYNEYRFVSDIVRTDSITAAIVGNFGGIGTVKDIVLYRNKTWFKIHREAYWGLGPMCIAENFLYVVENENLLIYNISAFR